MKHQPHPKPRKTIIIHQHRSQFRSPVAIYRRPLARPCGSSCCTAAHRELETHPLCTYLCVHYPLHSPARQRSITTRGCDLYICIYTRTYTTRARSTVTLYSIYIARARIQQRCTCAMFSLSYARATLTSSIVANCTFLFRNGRGGGEWRQYSARAISKNAPELPLIAANDHRRCWLHTYS